MNDVYNFLSLIERTSELAVRPLNGTRTGEFKTLNALTDPLLQMIVQLDDDALTRAGSSNVTVDRETFVRRCIDLTTKEELVFCPYDHIFANSTWSDVAIGIVLLVVSITALILCMVGIIQLTQSLMAGRVAVLVRKLVDQQFPSPFGWLTGYVVMVVGCVIVMIIQSSGVFRSTLIPLVGVGVVTLDKLYPLILGSNVGTTFSGVLAAFSSDPAKLTQTLQIAICQMIYNLLGIVLFYPIPPLRRFPIFLSMKLGDTVAKLSCPHCLPIKLRDWNFLPRPLHSLHPYDRAMMKYSTKIPVIGKLFKDSQEPSPRTPEGDSPLPAANGDDRKLLHQLSRQTQV
ncbi:Sodium-dependent phosphate transport protein [Aphelenchoides avenae]|nr:Sodium-dependent phosphate transport protein [Aphelenchus avenae]